MSEIPQTDVSRPSALPSAKLSQRGIAKQSFVEQNSSEYLDTIEEEWNKRVDMEVETLVDGMVDLVSLASVSLPPSLSASKFSYTSEVRSETRINFASHKSRSKPNLVLNPWYLLPLPCPPRYLIQAVQVRAANSLLSITHSMKLLLLLSDEAQLAHRRDAELKIVQEEKNDSRKKVAELLDDILHQTATSS